jgi:signal peptidase II
MSTKHFLRTVVISMILASNIGCDQISKSNVRQKIEYHEQISLIGNNFILTKIENTGAFLSLGDNFPEPIRFFLLTILPILVLAFGFIYVLTKKGQSKLMTVALCFLIGGGVGNIYDRLVYGSVTDFMHMDFGIFRTGVFNMADVSIMVGMGMVLLDSFLNSRALVPDHLNTND